METNLLCLSLDRVELALTTLVSLLLLQHHKAVVLTPDVQADCSGVRLVPPATTLMRVWLGAVSFLFVATELFQGGPSGFWPSALSSI
jgi:hypothetical protein